MQRKPGSPQARVPRCELPGHGGQPSRAVAWMRLVLPGHLTIDIDPSSGEPGLAVLDEHENGQAPSSGLPLTPRWVAACKPCRQALQERLVAATPPFHGVTWEERSIFQRPQDRDAV